MGILQAWRNLTFEMGSRHWNIVRLNVLVYSVFSTSLKNFEIKIHKTIILPVVLYGYEAWSLTIREQFRLRVFENSILRSIFGPKRDENGKWRRLHNEELHSLYC